MDTVVLTDCLCFDVEKEYNGNNYCNKQGTGDGTLKNSRYIIFNQNETKGQIEAAQSDMTQVEHTIANYFLNNEELTDFSSKRISALLYVSEATLSRFAKKCGI